MEKVCHNYQNHPMQRITENIWLGSVKRRKFIQEHNITSVIFIITERERLYFLEPVQCEEYPIDLDDKPSANLIKAVYQAKNILDDHPKDCFLIHCVMEISRSAAVLIGYLMLSHGLNYTEAYDKVKICRTQINPNDGFKRQLDSCWMPSDGD